VTRERYKTAKIKREVVTISHHHLMALQKNKNNSFTGFNYSGQQLYYKVSLTKALKSSQLTFTVLWHLRVASPTHLSIK
jgi:hypothetical protein